MASGSARAADDSLSRYAAAYLLRTPSARAMGMGDAYVAVVDDGQAIFYNPAGLAALKRPELTSMFAPQEQDQRSWSIGYAQPLGRWGAVGGGALLESINLIEARQAEFDVPYHINSLEGAGVLAYGYSPRRRWSVGAGVKYLFHEFTNIPDHGRGVAFDLGTRYAFKSPRGLSLGLSLQNLGGSFRWSTGKSDPLLFLAKTGLGYRATPWLLTAAQVDVRGNGRLRFHAGAEASYSVFAFRLGANHDHAAVGFGLSTPSDKIRLRFDYGFEFDPGGLDNINRLGLTLGF